MSFRPCLVIPCYNHGAAIGDTVRRLAVYGHPIFIVDDGSDAATQAALAAVAAECALVRLSRLPHNAGKGCAVMHGLREAHRAGLTHALQIDADGQHDTDDVPRFLALGEAQPEALVCGKPIYDASVPKGRLYGRYVTHFWVCVEILRLSVIDSMCGYRLYPLGATCALIDRVAIPERMDFDTEILVRLVWAGVPLCSLATRVIYPADGLSHFDMLRDNWRISKMHTRLVCGMLLRLPSLLWRRLTRNGAGERRWWRLGERGSVLGLKIVFACYRLLGVRVTRWLLVPVVGYFFLTGRRAREASLDYLRRVRRCAGLSAPGWRDSFRHMLAFAQAGLDKLAAWFGEMPEKVEFPGRAEFFNDLAASGRGAVLIGTHLGNLEMTRVLAVAEKNVVINLLVYTEHAQRFNALLRQANADFGANLIQISQLGPDSAILLKDKIERGELVVIVGDRISPAERRTGRTCRVEFLGSEASFAQGPMILAGLLDCPVYLFFCLRDGAGYRIDFERFAERIDLPRRGRTECIEAHVRRYAQRIEHYCLQAPEQWFNFYDFWQPTAAPTDKV